MGAYSKILDKGKVMRLLLSLILIAGFSSFTFASTRDRIIENTAAAMAAPSLCGLKLNMGMVQIVFDSAGLSAEQFAPGGVHYHQMEVHKQRILNLTDTEDGLNSFCRRVRTDLSAMFD